MKKIFTIISAIAFGMVSFAQQIVPTISSDVLERPVLDLGEKVVQPRTNPMLFEKTTSCEFDLVDYPAQRVTDYAAYLLGLGEGVLQRFPYNGEGFLVAADADVQSESFVNEGSFDGPEISMDFTVLVLNYDRSALLYAEDFTWDEADGPFATIIFTDPVFVDTTYWLFFMNNSTADNYVFWSNSDANGDGNGEGHGLLLANDLITGNPTLYTIGDADNLLTSYIENEITANYTVPAGLTINTPVAFTNTSVIDNMTFHNRAPNDPLVDLYTWDFGDGNTSTDANPENTYTTCGDYDVSLTVTYLDYDGVECTDTYVSTITINSDNSASASTTPTSSCGTTDGEVVITLDDPSEEFTVEHASTLYNSASSEVTIPGLAANTYNFVLTTATTQCDINVSAIVAETGAAELELASTDLLCFGDEDAVITLTSVDDISAYTFTWNTTEQGTEITVGAGTYSVNGTDGFCNVNASITVEEPAEVILDLSATDVTCAGEEDAVITVSSDQDISGYTFTWSTTEQGTEITVGAGTYTVSGTDGNCTAEGDITIDEPEAIEITGVVNGASINASATGGTGSLSGSWTGPNGFTAGGPTITVTENGTYTLTVTDENDCSATEDFVVSTVGLASNELTEVKVYPNPANEVINFELDGASASLISIYDASGKLIQSLDVQNAFASMNVSDVAEGLYFYHVLTVEGQVIASNKFLVAK